MENELKQKSENLLSGTIIYFVGNILTQLISIILLKYVTGAVTTEEYGYFNLVVTVDNLVTPMITLQISDAVFRFFIKAKSLSEKKYIYSSGTTIIIFGASLICVLIGIFRNKLKINYAFWVTLYIISTNLFSYNQKVVRSLKKNKLYVIANLFKSIFYFIFMVILVLKLKMGVKGLLISSCISTYICIFILMIWVRTYTYFSIHHISFEYIQKMLKFSAPLIPNTAIWWMQSSVNSIIIATQIGLDDNGIYSVAIKFASVLHLVINVFDLAWQESAITEYGTKNYKKFVTQTFNRYLIFIMSCVAVLIPLLRICLPYLIDAKYYGAVPYIPFLLFSTAFSAFSGYFAQIITAKNKNIRLLTTNIVGALTNIIIVFCLINRIGTWAVVISAIFSYCLISICRYKVVIDDFIVTEIEIKKIFLLLIVNFLLCVVYFMKVNMLFVVAFILTIGLSLFMNLGLLKGLSIYVKLKILNRVTK